MTSEEPEIMVLTPDDYLAVITIAKNGDVATRWDHETMPTTVLCAALLRLVSTLSKDHKLDPIEIVRTADAMRSGDPDE